MWRLSSAGTCEAQKTRDHQRPLHLGDAHEIALGLAAQRRDDGQEQEDVDRDEDGVEPVPVGPDQIVLEGQHDEEGGDQRPVVGAARMGERHELAQRREASRSRTAG